MDSDGKIRSERLDEIRRSLQQAHVVPLWETGAHTAGRDVPRGHHWRWSELRPLVDAAITMTDTQQAERRVLCLVNPDAKTGRNTVTNLNTNIQVLMPGERARPHRHTANALRFVLEGEGGLTLVDGKECPMSAGDLVITPGWSWHEHVHKGDRPLIWLDALDVALHQYLGTQVFQPGPAAQIPNTYPDTAFATAGITPVADAGGGSYSPLFRYAKAQWQAALAAAPEAGDGSQSIRFINPVTGAPAMPLLECGMTRIRRGQPTRGLRSTANAACLVVSGTGASQVGGERFAWSTNDIFTMPHENWVSHECASDDAVLFIVSDRDVLRRLGLLVDELA